MQFDDRLATVLRMRNGGARASHTQLRQLLDLVGTAPAGADQELLRQAFERVGALSTEIPAPQRVSIIAEPGLRLRNPELVAFLAEQDQQAAAAALGAARLTEAQWQALVPALPVPARAALRHRRDLPAGTMALLARLGVRELVLPEPDRAHDAAANENTAPLELDAALEVDSDSGAGIGALVRRIEAFQRARASAISVRSGSDAPRLPLGEHHEDAPPRKLQAFDFAADADGRIIWADPALAPMTVGISLASQITDAPARADAGMILAMRSRQPIRAGHVALEGAPAIAGDWRIDAAPHFSRPGGSFSGYRGRMRRPAEAEAPAACPPVDSQSDRMRQVLHELRTPVNAIQVSSEIIQQQLFGPAPNEYRALAAAIAGDAARMLAGFEELDRLAKLESGAIELEDGTTDLSAILAATSAQLDGVLRPRSAGFDLSGTGQPAPVPLARKDAELLVWRLLATMAGATSPGEILAVALSREGTRTCLRVDLPASLAGRSDIFASSAPAAHQAVTAGMFGTGFTMRLARAEARSAGGELTRVDEMLTLVLPPLTGQSSPNSEGQASHDGDVAGAA